MYYYIVDPYQLSQRQFERVQNQLYSSLSNNKIAGEISRVTSLRTIPQLVEIAVSHGAKTIIAVGGDNTLQEIISEGINHDLIFGYIPLLDTNLGQLLGLKDLETAVRSIAARRIASLDLGLVNNKFFLTQLSFGLTLDSTKPSWSLGDFTSLNSLPEVQIKFTADDQYHANLKVMGGIIMNSRRVLCNNTLGNPTDNIFDVLLLPKLSSLKILKYRRQIMNGCLDTIPGCSILHARKIEFEYPTGLALKIGEKIIARTPVVVEVKPQAVKIIVGKDRLF